MTTVKYCMSERGALLTFHRFLSSVANDVDIGANSCFTAFDMSISQQLTKALRSLLKISLSISTEFTFPHLLITSTLRKFAKVFGLSFVTRTRII